MLLKVENMQFELPHLADGVTTPFAQKTIEDKCFLAKHLLERAPAEEYPNGLDKGAVFKK